MHAVPASCGIRLRVFSHPTWMDYRFRTSRELFPHLLAINIHICQGGLRAENRGVLMLEKPATLCHYFPRPMSLPRLALRSASRSGIRRSGLSAETYRSQESWWQDATGCCHFGFWVFGEGAHRIRIVDDSGWSRAISGVDRADPTDRADRSATLSPGRSRFRGWHANCANEPKADVCLETEPNPKAET
jgi:hypothetical protein